MTIESKMKTVVVTGAGNGIGRSVVQYFLERKSYKVLAVDLDSTSLESLVNEQLVKFSGSEKRLSCCAVDLSSESQCSSDLYSMIDELGQIDILVLSHGIADEGGIEESGVWDKVVAVNLSSTQRLLAHATPLIGEGGRIIVVSSVLGRAGKFLNSAYCASKHALLGLVKSLALDLARQKITVNSVLPCWVDTPMLRRELEPQAKSLGISVDQVLRRIKKRIPIGRLLTPEDVAETIGFLASQEASAITAQSIVVDGGYGCGV